VKFGEIDGEGGKSWNEISKAPIETWVSGTIGLFDGVKFFGRHHQFE